ncbi:hypothetical protein NA78x_000937 [Anatilimnocola sp. NA78]|uniref:hypothetical protein n=1 Tax=Anatilimnocola sp. NA78 TaxID=3415683 RepID=UPI003CE55179
MLKKIFTFIAAVLACAVVSAAITVSLLSGGNISNEFAPNAFAGTLCAILTAPVWLPIAMLIYHAITAERFWQFSPVFLLTVVFLECVALAVSIGLWRLIVDLYENWPTMD